MSKGIMAARLLLSSAGLCVCFCWYASTTALALPAGRVYEMVSPIYKAGYGVTDIHATAPEGDGVAFTSLGGFAGVLSASGTGGNMYVSRRDPSGWSTVSLQPPFGSWTDFSANFEYILANALVGQNAGVENYSATEDEFLLHRTDAPETFENWQAFGDFVVKRPDKKSLQPIEEGASSDLCHVVLAETEGPLLPEAVEKNLSQVYDLTRGCEGEPSLRLVGLNNKKTLISSNCPVELGVGIRYAGSGNSAEQENTFNAISANGNDLFFTTNVEEGESNCSGGVRQLFVRIDGTRTLEVSKPLSLPQECTEVPCGGSSGRSSSYFKGASEDGSRVFFTTAAPLVGEDNNAGNDLYMATIGCQAGAEGCDVQGKEVTSLVQVSHDSIAGEGAEVQGVVRVAPDGSRAYFVARGVLTKEVNVSGAAPAKGADNLYTYDSVSGKLAFVADLCSDPGHSGEVKDIDCSPSLGEGVGQNNDTRLWGSNPEAQSAGPDGAFLVFSTYAKLLKDDTDNAKDIYRYDAQTGVLDRVSLGEAGNDNNGNDSAFDATIFPGHMGGSAFVSLQHEMSTRDISEDGTRILFNTAGPLSPDATNGLVNVYEWNEDSVSLISSGQAEADDGESIVISPSGRDVFFTTSQGLVPQDGDGLPDVYDARLGGGFTPVPVPRQPCSGDACQGPLTNPAPLLVPGSVVQVSGDNFPPPKKIVPKKKMKTKKTKKKKPRAKRTIRIRHHGRTARQGGVRR
jgi:hypothetical protein